MENSIRTGEVLRRMRSFRKRIWGTHLKAFHTGIFVTFNGAYFVVDFLFAKCAIAAGGESFAWIFSKTLRRYFL